MFEVAIVESLFEGVMTGLSLNTINKEFDFSSNTRDRKLKIDFKADAVEEYYEININFKSKSKIV